MPRVLNKYRDEIPKGAVYIGRPSKFGNPFEIGKDGTREEVIAKYKEYLRGNKALQKLVRRELSGKDVVCYCAPKPCHGDILVWLANRTVKEKV